MIPPPRMTRRLGTSVCASSPSESTQRSDSSRWIGVRSGKEPVAMIADLKLTSSLPSTPIVFASLNVPVPLIHSTLLDAIPGKKAYAIKDVYNE